LRIDQLTRVFGGLVAVSEVSFEVPKGEIVSLIGPNGAGKTTTLNIIGGQLEPTAGRVSLGGADITRKPPHEICSIGIGRTFQNLRLFGEMTAIENVMVGMHSRTRYGFIPTALGWRGVREQEAVIRDKARAYLERVEFPIARQKDMAGALPFGMQRLVELARALASEPKILLLDEPAAGLNPAEVERMMRFIKTLRDDGVTVLLVEHNMNVVMSLSDRVTVLDYGNKIFDGPPEAARKDARVIEAYLGAG
jgi:branched-chain amino acid transport system ATP-binding protein